MKPTTRRRPRTSLDRLDQALATLNDHAHLGPYAQALAKRKAADLTAEVQTRVTINGEPFRN